MGEDALGQIFAASVAQPYFCLVPPAGSVAQWLGRLAGGLSLIYA